MSKEQHCFDKLKNAVSSELVMKHFDQKLKSYLIVDAGPVGLGAILAQQQLDGSIRPIAYASRTLREMER